MLKIFRDFEGVWFLGDFGRVYKKSRFIKRVILFCYLFVYIVVVKWIFGFCFFDLFFFKLYVSVYYEDFIIVIVVGRLFYRMKYEK